jgi:hypothetical protein
MTTRKWLHVAFGVVILGLLSTASTGAIWNAKRTTYFTFNRAVEIPGMSLPAGTYVFELADPNTLNLVRILSRDRHRVYLTAFTKFVARPNTGNMDSALAFGESSAGKPPAIKVWYPQDETTGRQFIY